MGSRKGALEVEVKDPDIHRRRRVGIVNTRIWLTRGEEKTTLTTTWGINYSFYQVTLS